MRFMELSIIRGMNKGISVRLSYTNYFSDTCFNIIYMLKDSVAPHKIEYTIFKRQLFAKTPQKSFWGQLLTNGFQLTYTYCLYIGFNSIGIAAKLRESNKLCSCSSANNKNIDIFIKSVIKPGLHILDEAKCILLFFQSPLHPLTPISQSQLITIVPSIIISQELCYSGVLCHRFT